MDSRALDRFLATVERRAYRMAVLSTGNRDDALDIVQDAMAKLVDRYADRQASEWGPLFHRVLQSRITDWHRRRAVRQRWQVWLRPTPEREDDPLANQPDPSGRTPEQGLDRERMGESLDAALKALPPRQLQAFLLRAWEGMDVAQTARAMGCSQGSVKTHYSRAVNALRKRLEDHRI